MAKYLFQGSYQADGVKGLIRDGGVNRRGYIEQLIKSMGGTMETFYFAFGDTDLIVIADLPDNLSATAIALAVNASGVVSAKTTVLMTPDEVDDAVKKTPQYRPPGG